jgi:hypothetical protein
MHSWVAAPVHSVFRTVLVGSKGVNSMMKRHVFQTWFLNETEMGVKHANDHALANG